MHIIQNYTLKKNVVKKFLPLVMALLQGIKKLFNSRLPDSPIRGVDFRLRISPRIRIRKLVCRTYADLNYAKTSENSVHCHVLLIKQFLC